jgi:hypothetical protein
MKHLLKLLSLSGIFLLACLLSETAYADMPSLGPGIQPVVDYQEAQLITFSFSGVILFLLITSSVLLYLIRRKSLHDNN